MYIIIIWIKLLLLSLDRYLLCLLFPDDNSDTFIGMNCIFRILSYFLSTLSEHDRRCIACACNKLNKRNMFIFTLSGFHLCLFVVELYNCISFNNCNFTSLQKKIKKIDNLRIESCNLLSAHDKSFAI